LIHISEKSPIIGRKYTEFSIKRYTGPNSNEKSEKALNYLKNLKYTKNNGKNSKNTETLANATMFLRTGPKMVGKYMYFRISKILDLRCGSTVNSDLVGLRNNRKNSFYEI
jgi:hypothetical protein